MRTPVGKESPDSFDWFMMNVMLMLAFVTGTEWERRMLVHGLASIWVGRWAERFV